MRSDVENDVAVPAPLPAAELEVLERHGFDQVAGAAVVALDRRMDAPAAHVELDHAPRHEGMHLREKDQLLDPVREKPRRIVFRGEVDRATLRSSVHAGPVDELTKRSRRLREHPGLAVGFQLELELSHVLDEPVDLHLRTASRARDARPFVVARTGQAVTGLRRCLARRSSSAPQTTSGKAQSIARSRAAGGLVPNRCWSGGAATSAERKAISETIPQSRSGLLKKPIWRSEARSVRAARAVPTWQATMPAKVMVVACW